MRLDRLVERKYMCFEDQYKICFLLSMNLGMCQKNKVSLICLGL